MAPSLQVLQVIPDNWSVGLLHGFLISSVRKSINCARTTRVERMLARGENLQVQQENIALMGERVVMTESKCVLFHFYLSSVAAFQLCFPGLR